MTLQDVISNLKAIKARSTGGAPIPLSQSKWFKKNLIKVFEIKEYD